MSETSAQQWLQPIDTSALDPADPGVKAEIGQRWAAWHLTVSPAEAYGDDPQGLETHRLVYDDVRRESGLYALFTALVVAGALVLLFGLALLLTIRDGPASSYITSGILVGAAVLCLIGAVWIRTTIRQAPAKTRMYQELARQVRLAAMAGRNGAVYGPGELYSPIMSDVGWLASATPILIDSFVADGRLPAQWGNLALVRAQQRSLRNASTWGNPPMWIQSGPLAGYGLMRQLTYLAIRLPVRLPHIVIDAMPGGLKLGDGACEVSVDRDFDAIFHVYAPQGYESDARDLLPEDVRRGLAEFGYRARITLTRSTVVIERSGVDRFDSPKAWQDIWNLRRFVEEVWYPRLGEYVDPRAEQPVVGLSAYSRDAAPVPIVDGGTQLNLNPRPNVLAIAAIVSLILLGALGRLGANGWALVGLALIFGLLVIAIVVLALIRRGRVTRAREREVGPLDLR